MKTALSVPDPEDEITRQLNEVYDQERSEPDPVLVKIASRALPRESWK
jgi:hypothetical protein